MMEKRCVRVRVTGRVQGVGYRAWAQATGEDLGLAGWVRNEADGSVSALACGAPAAMSAFLDALWQGPSFAKVTGVASETVEEGPEGGFVVRR